MMEIPFIIIIIIIDLEKTAKKEPVDSLNNKLLFMGFVCANTLSHCLIAFRVA